MGARLLESIEYNCGPVFMEALRDESVIEIMLNPDGKLLIERYGEEHEHIGEILEDKSKQLLSLVASALNTTVDAFHPVVEGSFPLDGSRFEGTFPPIVGPGASFSLRKKASKIFTLSEYLDQGVITPEVVPLIHSAILERKNIVVVGGTSSGKTTFVNGIIHALDELCPHDRLLILEDTAELQSRASNSVFFRTSEVAGIGMRQLAKVCMRYAPKRILVGEVRDAAALELLKLWNTGHPGGIGTFHADSAEEALERLEELVEEAQVGPKQKLIGRAVDMVIFMEKTRQNTRRLASIISVNKFNAKEGCYETTPLYSAA